MEEDIPIEKQSRKEAGGLSQRKRRRRGCSGGCEHHDQAVNADAQSASGACRSACIHKNHHPSLAMDLPLLPASSG